MEQKFRIHVQLAMRLLEMEHENVKMVFGRLRLQHANVIIQMKIRNKIHKI